MINAFYSASKYVKENGKFRKIYESSNIRDKVYRKRSKLIIDVNCQKWLSPWFVQQGCREGKWLDLWDSSIFGYDQSNYYHWISTIRNLSWKRDSEATNITQPDYYNMFILYDPRKSELNKQGVVINMNLNDESGRGQKGILGATTKKFNQEDIRNFLDPEQKSDDSFLQLLTLKNVIQSDLINCNDEQIAQTLNSDLQVITKWLEKATVTQNDMDLINANFISGNLDHRLGVGGTSSIEYGLCGNKIMGSRTTFADNLALHQLGDTNISAIHAMLFLQYATCGRGEGRYHWKLNKANNLWRKVNNQLFLPQIEYVDKIEAHLNERFMESARRLIKPRLKSWTHITNGNLQINKKKYSEICGSSVYVNDTKMDKASQMKHIEIGPFIHGWIKAMLNDSILFPFSKVTVSIDHLWGKDRFHTKLNNLENSIDVAHFVKYTDEEIEMGFSICNQFPSTKESRNRSLIRILMNEIMNSSSLTDKDVVVTQESIKNLLWCCHIYPNLTIINCTVNFLCNHVKPLNMTESLRVRTSNWGSLSGLTEYRTFQCGELNPSFLRYQEKLQTVNWIDYDFVISIGDGSGGVTQWILDNTQLDVLYITLCHRNNIDNVSLDNFNLPYVKEHQRKRLISFDSLKCWSGDIFDDYVFQYIKDNQKGNLPFILFDAEILGKEEEAALFVRQLYKLYPNGGFLGKIYGLNNPDLIPFKSKQKESDTTKKKSIYFSKFEKHKGSFISSRKFWKNHLDITILDCVTKWYTLLGPKYDEFQRRSKKDGKPLERFNWLNHTGSNYNATKQLNQIVCGLVLGKWSWSQYKTATDVLEPLDLISYVIEFISVTRKYQCNKQDLKRFQEGKPGELKPVQIMFIDDDTMINYNKEFFCKWSGIELPKERQLELVGFDFSTETQTEMDWKNEKGAELTKQSLRYLLMIYWVAMWETNPNLEKSITSSTHLPDFSWGKFNSSR